MTDIAVEDLEETLYYRDILVRLLERGDTEILDYITFEAIDEELKEECVVGYK